MVKIEIISEEILKPSSSSTRDQLKTYKLSLLDQLAPSFYVPIVLFYSATTPEQGDHGTTAIVEKLKKSLSETLAQFYPLAGKIHDDASVEVVLEDEDGVVFVEARAHVKLSEILENPETSLVQQLLPRDPYKARTIADDNGGGVPVMTVQLNVFDCGGVGIGVCMSHKVADGTTLSTFLTAWASATCSSHCAAKKILSPSLDLASVFPPKEIHVQSPRNLIKRGRIVTKRFVFSASSLGKLKAKIAADMGSYSIMDIGHSGPTRVEAVTALICKTAMKNSTNRRSLLMEEKGFRPSMVISHVVNLRGRMVPPLPEHAFGNVWRCAVAPFVEEETKKLELHDLVAQLRKEIRKIDGDFAAKLRSEDGFLHACESLREVSELVSEEVVPYYKFSSWVRFPFYETDFGWGKPIWACITSVPIKDVVILMSNRAGDGIEAWISLEEEEMARFECDPELQQFASQAPGS